MKKLIKSYGFHPVVWVLLGGTILTRCAACMTLPFLAVYLTGEMEMPALLTGLAIGISPLMAAAGGFIGGNLSDRFGRRRVMFSSLFAISLVYMGFALSHQPLWFILLNALNGFCNSFFEPVSQALIADLTDKENRMKAYSLRYTAINIGASAGPLLGAVLALLSAKAAFAAAGGVYFVYGILLALLMKRWKETGRPAKSAKEPVSFRAALNVIRKDHALLWLIAGGMIVNVGYTQMESSLPQMLDHTIANGVFIYSVLLSINALMVIIFQIPISAAAEKIPKMGVMMAGAVMTSLGLLGFGIIQGWVTAVIAIMIFTVGEILIYPSNSYLIDQLAPEELKGTYFGASQFRKAGNFAGPVIGGFLLGYGGGFFVFSFLAVLTAASLFFFHRGGRIMQAAKKPERQQEEEYA